MSKSKKMKPQLFFRTEDGIYVPVERLETDDVLLVTTNTKAARDRIVEQFPAELADQLSVVIVKDPEVVSIESSSPVEQTNRPGVSAVPAPAPARNLGRVPGQQLESPQRPARTPNQR